MKKLNLLLTISLVSLFISLILVIIGNKNAYCLSFGFLFLAVAIGLFTTDRVNVISNKIKQNKKEVEEYIDELDSLVVYEIENENKKLTKMRISLIMGAVVFAVLLIVLAFLNVL